MSVNQITLVGNIGQEPRVGGQESNPIANFSLATTYKFKDKQGDSVEETTWHNVSVFGHAAKFVIANARKGTKVFVQGRLRNREWTDKDGNVRKATEVVADIVELLGNKPGSEQPAARQPQAQTPAPARSTPAPTPAPSSVAASDDMDGDIPF